jgi:hypothetical protein
MGHVRPDDVGGMRTIVMAMTPEIKKNSWRQDRDGEMSDDESSFQAIRGVGIGCMFSAIFWVLISIFLWLLW